MSSRRRSVFSKLARSRRARMHTRSTEEWKHMVAEVPARDRELLGLPDGTLIEIRLDI